MHFEDFWNIFMPNIGEDLKKSYHLSVGPLVFCHLVNLALVIAIHSQRWLDESLR